MAIRHLQFEAAGGADLTRGSILFIGTATVLIRYAGFTILTDPNFVRRGERVRLGYGVRARRLTDPAADLDALPPLDLSVLSCLNEAHWDRVADTRLPRSLPVATTPAAAARLHDRGFVWAQPLDTWDTLECTKGAARLRVTAMPGRLGPRWLARLLGPVMGSLLEFETIDGRRLLRLYLTGDTLVDERMAQIRARCPDIDVALLHLGGARLLGVGLTMDGRQGVELIRLVDPRLAIPIHYDDYPAFISPLTDFQDAVTAARLEDRVHYLGHGDIYSVQVPRARLARPAKAG
jgi:L-ascorbate metabolism protein UlaG (beta-lactamase superfamily)